MIDSIEEEVWKENTNILNNLSFSFEKWKVYWIVGKNWAWKTSMMYLLAWFFRDYSGEILFNWNIAKNFKTSSFLDKVSFLSQSPFNMWWNSSVRENLLLWASEDINDEQIYHYLEKFWLAKKIKKQKKWLDSMIWDDIEFSGWENQIIAFIRILLQNRDIVILDEWTNQLDAENELKVMNELLKYKNDKIIIFITHRMSTIAKANEIYCLEEWYFKNHWKHKDLLEKSDNIYASFYKTQVNHEE
jgi:ABC-type transport system involved in cytochrome bd biosynthesis fused ATPase/permease subunit